MMPAMRPVCSTITLADLRTASPVARSEAMSDARPEMTLSGVPSSWAMPEASSPTVVSRSA